MTNANMAAGQMRRQMARRSDARRERARRPEQKATGTSTAVRNGREKSEIGDGRWNGQSTEKDPAWTRPSPLDHDGK
jgi:hypothetical protein